MRYILSCLGETGGVLYAQPLNCGTDPVSEDALFQRYQAVGFIPGSFQTASNIQTSYNIPLKVFVITSGGVTNFPDPDFWMQEAIRWTNERTKSENISFYLSGIENKENPSYFQLLSNPSLSLIQLTDLYGDPQALNVFIVDQIAGASGLYNTRNGAVNNAIVISPAVYGRYSVLAHEIGHFLGLAHTHNGSEGELYCSGELFKVPKFRPDNTCFATVCGSQTTFNGSNTGDLIPDTNIDPYVPELDLFGCFQANCDDACPIVIEIKQPEQCTLNVTLVYYPPRDNVMSYYFESCITKFTPKQLELMKRMLDNEAGYAFLRDQILPNDQTVSGNFPAQGKVWYPFDPDGVTGSTPPSLYPFSGLKVKIDRNGTVCNSITNSFGNYSICQSSTNGQTYLYGPDLIGETATWSQALTGVSTLDIVQIQKYRLGLRKFSNYHLVAADADADGVISTADIDRIRSVILGTTTDFSPLPNWRFIPYAGLFGWIPSAWLWENPVTDGTHAGQTKPFYSHWMSFTNQLRKYNCSTCDTYFNLLGFTAPSRAAMNEKAWSFVGVKMGDLNFSLDIANTPFRAPEIDVSFARPSSLRSGEDSKLTIHKGDQFNVMVTGKGKRSNVNVLGYQFALEVKPSLAKVVGVSPGEVRKFEPESFAIDLKNEGGIKTVWVGDDPLRITSEKVLFQVVLEAIEDISKLEDVLRLNPELLAPEFISDRDELLDFELGFKVKKDNETFTSVKVFPNPTQNDLNFELQCKQSGQVEIALSDAFGHSIKQVYKVGEGKNILSFDNTNKLLPGVLHYWIIGSGIEITGQVLKH